MRLEFEPNTTTLLFTETESLEINADSNRMSEALRQGIEAAQAGNRARARALFLRVTEADTRNEDAWLWLASVSEYPEELVIFLGNVLDVNPQNQRAVQWMKETKSLLAKTFVERGIEAARSDRTDFARQCFYQAAAHDSKNEMPWLWLASIAATPVEKQTHLTRALAINPDNADAQAALQTERDQTAQNLLRLASTQALSGERATALGTLAEILKISPQHENALILKAHLTDDFAAKINCFASVLEINPANDAARAGLESLNALRNIAAAVAEEQETENFNSANDFAETEDFQATNISEETFDQAKTPEYKDEETEDFENEAGAAAHASFDESADATSEARETEVFFAESALVDPTASEENLGFKPPVSFDSFEENEREANTAQTEPSNDIFQFDAAPVESASVFDDEILDGFNGSDNFTVIGDERKDLFFPDDPTDFSAELDETVFAPSDVDAAPSDFAPHAGETSPPAEVSAVEASEAENDFAEKGFSRADENQQSAFTEETKVFATTNYDADTLNQNAVFRETAKYDVKAAENSFACPFCAAANDVQSYACGTCRAVLSLSEMELLIANENADRYFLSQAVERMEGERESGDFGEYELMSLGIAHVNLKNFRRGLAFLQQASRTNPNNVVLSSQVNAFALRLEEIERREENADEPSPSRTILVVDDSATVRKLISGKLEKSGHEVVCAVDGMDALAKLEETAPDLILLDITMPRMDGYQVCKMIRGNPATRSIPVVMISGKDGFFDKVRGRMAGTTGYITKPFGPETLMKALDVYIKNTHEQIVAAEA